MKKLFFCVIVLLLIPVCCYAEVRGKAGEKARWSISEDGVLTISGTPPLYTYDEYDDLYYERPWFKYNDRISSITVNKGFIDLPAYCFYGLSNVTSVSLPDSIKYIGYAAFEGCSSLTSIVIPQGVKWIDFLTFSGCSNLSDILIPESVGVIQQGAFERCRSLSKIILPGNTDFVEDSFDKGITIVSSCNSRSRASALEYGLKWEMYGTHDLVRQDGHEPTCVEPGNEPYWECSKCHAYFSDSDGENEIDAPVLIPIVDHTVVIDPEVPATCTATGLTAGSHCSVCHKVFVAQEVTEKIDHTYAFVPEVEATCYSEGASMGIICNVCGKWLVAPTVTPMKSHTIVDSGAVAPTETAAGHTEGKICSVCGAIIEGIEIPALCNMNVLYLPASVKHIEDYSFTGIDCQAIIIPFGCETIGEHAFADCASVLYVKIPSSVVSCPQNAFSECNPDVFLDFSAN